jgi:hypothetical protein
MTTVALLLLLLTLLVGSVNTFPRSKRDKEYEIFFLVLHRLPINISTTNYALQMYP